MLVVDCEKCGGKLVVSKSGRIKFDAPREELIDELAIGKRSMPDSMRLVVVQDHIPHVRIMPRTSRGLYLNIHRCSKPERLRV